MKRLILAQALLVVVAGACSAGGYTQEELDSAVSVAAAEALATTPTLAESVHDPALVAAEAREGELEALVAQLEASLTELRENADTADAELAAATGQLAQAKRDLTDAQRQNTELQTTIAELTLAYSDEIDAARTTLAAAASAFACDWGALRATAGHPLGTVSGSGALAAFTASDGHSELMAVAELAAAVGVLEIVGDWPYGVSPDDMGVAASECWQTEDAKQNAALYQHQDVFRNAVLDASCTHGADRASSRYDETAEYQTWQLDVGGYLKASEYVDAVTDRLGDVIAFAGVTQDEMQAEDDRCEPIRELIDPKGSGTWNVGTEIKAGTWKAFDESDCYWARLAVDGGIRDNHFGDGLRLTVNVSSSDGQFEVSSCKFFYLNP